MSDEVVSYDAFLSQEQPIDAKAQPYLPRRFASKDVSKIYDGHRTKSQATLSPLILNKDTILELVKGYRMHLDKSLDNRLFINAQVVHMFVDGGKDMKLQLPLMIKH